MARRKAPQPYEIDGRGRRVYPEETRAEALRLVLDEGKSQADVAKQLQLSHPSIVSNWLLRERQAKGQPNSGVAGGKRALALERVAKGRDAGEVAAQLFLRRETLERWIAEDRAAKGEGEPLGPSHSDPSIPTAPLPFAVPVGFPPAAADAPHPGEILEQQHDHTAEVGVSLSGFSMEIHGLPTRQSPMRSVRTHPATRAKPLIISARCPHCDVEVPPPPKPEPGRLIATQFACPSCEGPVTLP